MIKKAICYICTIALLAGILSATGTMASAEDGVMDVEAIKEVQEAGSGFVTLDSLAVELEGIPSIGAVAIADAAVAEPENESDISIGQETLDVENEEETPIADTSEDPASENSGSVEQEEAVQTIEDGDEVGEGDAETEVPTEEPTTPEVVTHKVSFVLGGETVLEFTVEDGKTRNDVAGWPYDKFDGIQYNYYWMINGTNTTDIKTKEITEDWTLAPKCYNNTTWAKDESGRWTYTNGDLKYSPFGIAHVHSWEEEGGSEDWVVILPPTCGEEGKKECVCTNENCTLQDSKKTEVVPATGNHSYESVGDKEPTCTETGHEGGQKCSVCGATTEGQDIAALGHNYEDVDDIEPTCTEAGYDGGRKCSRCGDVIEAKEIPALGHKWGEWKVTLAPTCGDDGQKIRACQNTSCTETDTESISKTGNHNYVLTGRKEPDCENSGYAGGEICTACGDVKGDTIALPATGHSWGDTEEGWKTVKEPTCAEEGKQERICTNENCPLPERKQEASIPATGQHSYESTEDKTPTCTEAGYKDAKKCAVCGDIAEAKEIPALGHKYELIGDREATCTDPGHKGGRKCCVCGDIIGEEEIPALGHNYEAVGDIEPTCTEPGYKGAQKCCVCGDIIGEEEIPAAGHSWENDKEGSEGWTTTLAPTCITSGEQERICTVEGCNYKETASLSAAGHLAQEDSAACGICGEKIYGLTADTENASYKLRTNSSINLRVNLYNQESESVPDDLIVSISAVSPAIASIAPMRITAALGIVASIVPATVIRTAADQTLERDVHYSAAISDDGYHWEITLFPEYLETLAAGEYTVRIQWGSDDDKKETIGRLILLAEENKPDDSPGGGDNDQPNNSDSANNNSLLGNITNNDSNIPAGESVGGDNSAPKSMTSPQTGDETDLRLWLVIALLSGMGLAAVSIAGRKKCC